MVCMPSERSSFVSPMPESMRSGGVPNTPPKRTISLEAETLTAGPSKWFLSAQHEH